MDKKKVKKEETDIMDTQEWKDAAKKQTSRIMDIWKKTQDQTKDTTCATLTILMEICYAKTGDN